MSEKILQICPCSEKARVARYNNGNVELCVPTCLALIEKGASREVVYMETVDNEVQRVDNEDKEFMGLVDSNDNTTINGLIEQAQERFKKENVKSK